MSEQQMKDVTQDSLLRLLDLQTEDVAVRRLEHRKAELPESKRLAELNDHVAELQADLEIAAKQAEEIAREQNRLEGEIEISGQKIAREEQRLFSGSVANPKELNALQAEVQMLRKQRSALEDDLLEVMEQKEQADATAARIRSELEGSETEATALGARVEELTGEIDAELATHTARRAELAGEIPDQLLKTYEQIRAAKGGVGAAALQAGVCQGCHTSLPAKEVQRLKAAGGVQRCENCRRILVVV